MFRSLRTPGAIPLPPITAEQAEQWMTDSPAPAGPSGGREARAGAPRRQRYPGGNAGRDDLRTW
jgi:hypothetical protein